MNHQNPRDMSAELHQHRQPGDSGFESITALSKNPSGGSNSQENLGISSKTSGICLEASSISERSVTASRPATHKTEQAQSRPSNVKGQRQLSNWISLCNRWWYWELACMFLGTCCIVAVIIILATVNGIALDSWKFPIQPNSLISVFITVGKSALLLPVAECISQAKWIQFKNAPHPLVKLQEYDEASRGPWGSLQLLLNWLAGICIAQAGALLTILALALEPFTQQIIAYPSRQVTPTFESASQRATRDLDFFEQVAMNGAVLEGIYFSQIASAAFNCTTSSCTWPTPFVSLGVCSACRDVTTLTNLTLRVDTGPLVPASNENWSFRTTSCTYSLNNTYTLSTYIQTIHFPLENSRPAEDASEWTQIKMISPDVDEWLGSFLERNRTYLATVLSYSTFFDQRQKRVPSVTPELLSPEIFACGLYWCGQVYNNVSVVNGTLRSAGVFASYDLGMMYHSDGSRVAIQTNRTRSDVFRVSEDDRASFPANDTFTVSESAHIRLSDFFYQLFNITKLGGNEDFPVFPDIEQGLYGISDAIFKNKNITKTFENIATAMTEQVRVSNSSFGVSGLAWSNETYVNVRWAWMTLPLAVLVMSAAHLACTIITNGARGQRIWKSSSLALLFHGLNRWSPDELKLENIQEMESAARVCELS
ncbi:hypothetical protein MPH_12776 [Macrophomina phaseolina MS6]|uniref:Uncharacterized protein n=1 Tax=Macrophomina phaseolina (strain MS6) TaxID=1126212 RepID=K2QK17_MACPH|nr:hypothetical protein MPH_12776 [Macrophomina phaseolina MS6]